MATPTKTTPMKATMETPTKTTPIKTTMETPTKTTPIKTTMETPTKTTMETPTKTSMATPTKTTMANKYLMTKWELWFKSLDVKRDGVLSYIDMEESKKLFTQLHKLDITKGTIAVNKLDKWWKVNILQSHTGDVHKEMFIDNLNKEYMADKMKFVHRLTECFKTLFTISDINNDGYLTEDEYIIFFKVFGHTDENMMRTMFHSFKPVKGLVKVDTVTDAWVTFTTNDNETVPCLVKDALEREKIDTEKMYTALEKEKIDTQKMYTALEKEKIDTQKMYTSPHRK